MAIGRFDCEADLVHGGCRVVQVTHRRKLSPFHLYVQARRSQTRNFGGYWLICCKACGVNLIRNAPRSGRNVNKRPSITVLMLCWNHAQYIEQAILSLAQQTDQQFNLVFLDNASADGSAQLAERMISRHSLDGRVVTNEIPQGISVNLNKLLALASGEIVTAISSDDWYHADYIAEVRKAAAAYPCASLYYPNAFHYDDSMGTTSNRPEAKFLNGNLWEYTRCLDWRFGFLGLAYRREDLVAVGGWDVEMIAEDNDLLFRLSEGRVFIHIPRRLFYYRISSTSISANPAFTIKNWKQFFEKHQRHFPNRHRLLFSYSKSYAMHALRKRKLDQLAFISATAVISLLRMAFSSAGIKGRSDAG